MADDVRVLWDSLTGKTHVERFGEKRGFGCLCFSESLQRYALPANFHQVTPSCHRTDLNSLGASCDKCVLELFKLGVERAKKTGKIYKQEKAEKRLRVLREADVWRQRLKKEKRLRRVTKWTCTQRNFGEGSN